MGAIFYRCRELISTSGHSGSNTNLSSRVCQAYRVPGFLRARSPGRGLSFNLAVSTPKSSMSDAQPSSTCSNPVAGRVNGEAEGPGAT